MINAIIIEDEQHCINRLTSLLATTCAGAINIRGAYNTVQDSLQAINILQPQLVFLDIEIGDKTGFDLLKQLPVINFDVIFTTAFDKYAVQAFKFSAIDYLLKPIDADDLKTAVNKLANKISAKEMAQKLDALFHNLQNVQGVSKRICVPVVTGLVFIEVNDIIRCESNINYTTLFMKDKQKLVVAKTLKEFEELLSPYNFYRVHNSHLVNLALIKSYNKGKGGSVTMQDGIEIDVSTRRKDDFLRKITAL